MEKWKLALMMTFQIPLFKVAYFFELWTPLSLNSDQKGGNQNLSIYITLTWNISVLFLFPRLIFSEDLTLPNGIDMTYLQKRLTFATCISSFRLS